MNLTFDIWQVILKKILSSQNNPEKSSTKKKGEHEPSVYTLSLTCSIDATKNKQDYKRG